MHQFGRLMVCLTGRFAEGFCKGFCTKTHHYDVAVIGGGPGGYVAAIKAAQLGLNAVCIEKTGLLGGTCLNVGCIPSKCLLSVAHKYKEMQRDFSKMGIDVHSHGLNIKRMQTHRLNTIKGLNSGIEFLFKKNKITLVKGSGSLIQNGSKLHIRVDALDGSQTTVSATNIILATGSEPSPMPGGILEVDNKLVFNSTGCLEYDKVPEKLVVIGAGVIGVELGSVWGSFGAHVDVIEYLDRPCPGLDYEIVDQFKTSLEKRGLVFHLSRKVVDAKVHSDHVSISTESASGGNPKSFDATAALVAVGRRPFTKNLGLEELGIKTEKNGMINVDESFRVSGYKNLFAIGDLIKGPMLAHKAEEEGIACAELITGKGAGHVNYETVPSVVYTDPELAGVGKTEQQLVSEGIQYKKASFPFAANSRARANDAIEGSVKILTDAVSDKILGAWILGTHAGELIQEIVLGLEYGASAEDIARTFHAHPTLSEAVKEACQLVAFDRAIHIP